jgi:hypothetical protein
MVEYGHAETVNDLSPSSMTKMEVTRYPPSHAFGQARAGVFDYAGALFTAGVVATPAPCREDDLTIKAIQNHQENAGSKHSLFKRSSAS